MIVTAEQVRECVQHVYYEGYNDGSVHRAHGIEETDWQAIADELNATLESECDEWKAKAEEAGRAMNAAAGLWAKADAESRELRNLAYNAWAMALYAMQGMPIPADWNNSVEQGLRKYGINVDMELEGYKEDNNEND